MSRTTRPEPTPVNQTLLQTFEWHTASEPPAPHETRSSRSHYARLLRMVHQLADLGITSLWLPPGCKANNPNGNGYDCYDLWDLGEFDQKWARSTKWGSREEFNDLIKAAHDHGLKIVWDAVLNHKTAGDATDECWAVECDPEDRRRETSTPRKIEAWLKYDFPGRGEKYSSFKWRAEHFNGTDWDQKGQRNALYKLIDEPSITNQQQPKEELAGSPRSEQLNSWSWRRSRNQIIARRQGKGWADDVGEENGNNDYLIFSNIDYSHPSVRQDVQKWGSWMLDDVQVDGFRLDATQHVSYSFTRDWIRHITRSREIFVVGEVWTGDVQRILKWLDVMDNSGRKAHAFDSPLLYNFSHISQVFQTGNKKADLRRVLDGSLLQRRASSAVTLVANHDTQPGQTSYTPMSSMLKPFFYAFILLRQEGLPCVFWGDLLGIGGNHGELPACMEGDRSLLCDLLVLRQKFAYGKQRDYWNKAHCIAWSRAGTHDRPGCVVLINIAMQSWAESKSIKIGQSGERWVNVLDKVSSPSAVKIGALGYGKFYCSSMRVAVYVRDTDARELQLPYPYQDLQKLM